MMAPTVVLRDGIARLVLGSAGEPDPQRLLQVIVNMVDRGMNAQEAMDAPRLHYAADELYAEPGIRGRARRDGAAVTTFRAPNLFFGGCQAVARDRRTVQLSGVSMRARRSRRSCHPALRHRGPRLALRVDWAVVRRVHPVRRSGLKCWSTRSKVQAPPCGRWCRLTAEAASSPHRGPWRAPSLEHKTPGWQKQTADRRRGCGAARTVDGN